MRVEPPPSLACAIGIMPAATAAAAPPDEPPVVRVGSHGLRVAPNRRGSVVGTMPNSGRFVVPTMIAPASRRRVTPIQSNGAMKSPKNDEANVKRLPSTGRLFLIAIGTPASGRSSPGLTPSAASSASSWKTSMKAL